MVGNSVGLQNVHVQTSTKYVLGLFFIVLILQEHVYACCRLIIKVDLLIEI